MGLLMRFLFLLFVLIPIVEIVLLINVGQAIGGWYTVGLVLLSAFIGVNMLRQQGLSTLMRARSRMDGGEIPAQEMIEGLILAVGGALLITPGFVTDFFGFCCLIPAVRLGFVKRLKHHFTIVAAQQGQTIDGQRSQQPEYDAGSIPSEQDQDSQHSASPDPLAPHSKPKPSSHAGHTIDGEYRRDD